MDQVCEKPSDALRQGVKRIAPTLTATHECPGLESYGINLKYHADGHPQQGWRFPGGLVELDKCPICGIDLAGERLRELTRRVHAAIQ